jgi:hypothetical protein
VVKEREPKALLCSEAEGLMADCIFVGARGMGRLERFLIGSVSSGVAARAHCSVEVVRARDDEEWCEAAPYENALTVAGYEISGDGEDFDQIHAQLSALRPGGKLIVKVLRGGKVIELSADVDKK